MKVNLDVRDYEVEEGVVVTISPLEQGDYQKVMGFMGQIGSGSDDYLDKFSDPALVKIISEIVPKYCASLSGVEITVDGTERNAVVDDLIKYSVFMMICVNIVTKLFKISTITPKEEGEVKK